VNRSPNWSLQCSGDGGRRCFAALGALFFLQNREDKAGADNRDEPNELCLQDFLFALEDVASEHAIRKPRLERNERQERCHEDAVEEVHEVGGT